MNDLLCEKLPNRVLPPIFRVSTGPVIVVPMPLPTQIGDEPIFSPTIAAQLIAQPLVDANEETERSLGILIRATTTNIGIVYVGNSDHQVFELEAGDGMQVHTTRRNKIYVRGTPPDTFYYVAMMTSGLRDDICRR
jgi:hypothetical protein